MLNLISTLLTLASPAPETAENIARRALGKNLFSITNAQAEIELQVFKKGKVIRVRQAQIKIRHADGKKKLYIESFGPSAIVGTKFLSIEDQDGNTEQMVYLPGLRRIKRVVDRQRRRSFMSTDFTYEDFDSWGVRNASWRRLKDKKVGGQLCYVVEGIPKRPEDESYTKKIFWVHKQHLVIMRADFFGDAKRVAKRFSARRLKKQSGRWFAANAVMATLAKKTETRLRMSRVDFERLLVEAEFNRQALEQ